MVSVTVKPPATDLILPTRDELRSLWRIVIGAYPELQSEGAAEAEFRAAFIGVGFMFRTAEPVTSRYFASIVVDINEMLTERWSLQPVDGRTVLAAALAHADICWRRADPAAGVLLEIGLNPYNGRPCVNAWRDLLAGKANLVQPTPPPARVTRAQSAPPARILSRGRERAAADPSPMIGACGDDRGKSWARFSFPRPPPIGGAPPTLPAAGRRAGGRGRCAPPAGFFRAAHEAGGHPLGGKVQWHVETVSTAPQPSVAKPKSVWRRACADPHRIAPIFDSVEV